MENFSDFLETFAKNELNISFTENDDFDTYVFKPIVALYDKQELETSKAKPEYMFDNYLSMDFDELLEIAESVFFIELQDFLKTDTKENREYIFSQIETSYSLDNLTKTGLRKSYESQGFKNVRVMYDKDNERLKVFGERDETLTYEEEDVRLINGIIKLDFLKENEEIADIKKIKITTETSEQVLYDEDEIVDQIKEILSYSQFDDSKSKIEDLLNEYKQLAISYVTEDKEIHLNSGLVSSGLIRDPEAEAAFKTLLQYDFDEDYKELEFLSFLALILNKRLREKMTYLASDEIKNNVTYNYNVAYDGIVQSINDVMGKTKEELLEEYYKEEKIPQEEKKLLYQANEILVMSSEANELLAEAQETLEEFMSAKEDLSDMVENLVAEEGVQTFVNQLSLTKTALIEITNKLNTSN